MKRFFRRLCVCLTPVCAAALVAIGVYGATVPSTYVVAGNSELSLPLPLTAVETASAADHAAEIRLLGVFPVKEVAVRQADNMQVVLGGEVFGMKLYTDGVLVVGMTDVDTSVGNRNPAAEAGICKGDLIRSINGEAVTTMKEVAAAVEQSEGAQLDMEIMRDGVSFHARFTPVFSVSENRYKAGIWVRDSSAGIGTLTFYHPTSGVFAGLGHPVCDADTGEILPIAAGEAVAARVYSVDRGVRGDAGSLCGGFAGRAFGTLRQNDENGVYGTAEHWSRSSELVEIAPRQEVTTGAAQIRCTVDDGEPRWYDVTITKVRYAGDREDMHLTVTDPDLLTVTGGIVQGMSGSPIIQNGKLIGAVTHVLVDDPTKGYGIFAQTMLEVAQSVGDGAATSRIKEAS